VIAAFKLKYPKDADVQVGEIVWNTFAGNLAVIISKEDGRPSEEVCYVSPDGKVTLFETTNELARFLESRLNRGRMDKLFSKGGVSAVVTIILLVTLCALAFFPEKINQQVVAFLGAAFAAAVGFLFGCTGQRSA
jgi:hypothetical protein